MEYSKFYLVIGIFFQKKDMPTLEFDPQIEERVMVQSNIEKTVFSGVINTSLGVGTFQDKLGVSEIIISSFKTDFQTKVLELSFLKEDPTHTISFELLSTDFGNGIQEWIGKWFFQEDSGPVRMKTIEIDEITFFDYKSIEKNELFKQHFPEKDQKTLIDPGKESDNPNTEEDLPF